MTQGLLHGAVFICFPKCDSPFYDRPQTSPSFSGRRGDGRKPAGGGEEDKNGNDGYLYTE